MPNNAKVEHTFKDKAIEDLEELFDLKDAEQAVENPREYAEQVRNELNWYRSLLQYLEMWIELSGREIGDTRIIDMDWQSNKQYWSKDGFYRSNWWRMRRDEILERDDYECQNCGLTNEEQKSRGKTDRGLEVHHIKKRLNFPKSERGEEGKAHENDNLVSLCTKCHAQLESRKPKRQREILNFPKH